MSFWYNQLKDWLFPTQDELEPEASQNELPVEVAYSLSKAIQNLPSSPATYREAVQAALCKALERWQEDDDATNSLIVLGSPAEQLSSVLDEVLEADHQISQGLSVKHLPGVRPTDYGEIASKLAAAVPKDASARQQRELVVIPNLSGYFLRCIRGLEGIVYLRDTIAKERSQFWLVGCNYWAWQYLDYVCQTRAYFEETISLPVLSKTEIKEWLEPIGAGIELDVGNKLPEAEPVYIEKLAGISLGIATVAARLWLRSLHYQPTGERAEQQVIREKPSLPKLPDLTASDRYLLYSMLLHEQMSFSDLAMSLGETESRIHSHVQRLRRLGLIEENPLSLQVNPIHYPRLRLELKQNNFLVVGEN